MRRKESSASLKSDSNDSGAVEQPEDVTDAAVETVIPLIDNVPRTATAGPPTSRFIIKIIIKFNCQWRRYRCGGAQGARGLQPPFLYKRTITQIVPDKGMIVLYLCPQLAVLYTYN